MKTLFTSLILLMGLSYGLPQQIDLTGQISIHNSRYRTGQIEYVADAYVQAPFAGSTKSDSKGQFGLTFQGIESGTVIKLAAEKAGWEVVNTYDLERVVLGQKSKLPVYLAPKGRLAEAQTQLYNISKTALFARRDATIDRLQDEKAESDAALAELERDWGIEIGSVGEAMELLYTKIEELRKRLPEFAQELAAKNLDFASELYIQAYELYQAGDIEGAIAVLDDAKLAQSYEEALATIAEGENLATVAEDLQEKGHLQIDQVVESYRLKAKSYQLIFDYRAAVAVYVKIVEMLEQTSGGDSDELADAYNDVALTYQHLGQYDQALAAQQKALTITEGLFGFEHPEVAVLRNNMATIYLHLGQYEQALQHQQIALPVLEQFPAAVDSTKVATAHHNLAAIYNGLRKNEEALTAQQKALDIQQRILPANDPDIALSYSNMAAMLQALGQAREALTRQQQALAIRKKILPPHHPRLATSYNNLASIYDDLGEQELALDAQMEALSIQNQNKGGNAVSIALAYNNFAVIYQNQGRFEKALAAQDSAHRILLPALGPDHPSTLISYNNFASIYYDLGVYEKSIEYFDTSYQRKGMTELPYANTTGLAYLKLGNMELAHQRFTRLQELLPNHALPFRNWAVYYSLNEAPDQAMDHLEKSFQLGYDNWTWLKTEKALDPLRDLPRFKALLAQAPDQKD